MTQETIMIVDDDEIARRLLHGTLAPHYRVLSARSALEALAMLADGQTPDLILSDIMMPDLSGYDFCAQVKADPQTKHLPFIFVTALSFPKQEEEGLKLGAADYINKPVRPGLLLARIRAQLELAAYREKLLGQLDSSVNQLADSQRALQALTAERSCLFEVMGEMLACRDHYTSEHALRVAELSVRMGRALNLDTNDLETLELGCLVHDIGKVAIPDDVLLKPGRFDKQDRQIMEFHPQIGARLFARRFENPGIAAIILQHHERLDGGGYPNRLCGPEIDPLAKVVMVADIYEALIAKRPYKQPLNRENALGILLDEARHGKVLKEMVQTIEPVTADFDPLQLRLDTAADYLTSLESFRRKTYFREPLSDFYNYRYLTSLHLDGRLCQAIEHYHILKTDFNELKELNSQIGYARADTILDQIGRSFHEIIEGALTGHGLPTNALMLLRRGSDYLIYSECELTILEGIKASCQKVLDRARHDWGIKASLNLTSFPKAKSVDDALDEMDGYHRK